MNLCSLFFNTWNVFQRQLWKIPIVLNLNSVEKEHGYFAAFGLDGARLRRALLHQKCPKSFGFWKASNPGCDLWAYEARPQEFWSDTWRVNTEEDVTWTISEPFSYFIFIISQLTINCLTTCAGTWSRIASARRGSLYKRHPPSVAPMLVVRRNPSY